MHEIMYMNSQKRSEQSQTKFQHRQMEATEMTKKKGKNTYLWTQIWNDIKFVKIRTIPQKT